MIGCVFSGEVSGCLPNSGHSVFNFEPFQSKNNRNSLAHGEVSCFTLFFNIHWASWQDPGRGRRHVQDLQAPQGHRRLGAQRSSAASAGHQASIDRVSLETLMSNRFSLNVMDP